MIIKGMQPEIVEIVKDVLCNRCGQSCKLEVMTNEYNFEYATLDVKWGYGTKKDGEDHIAHVCYSCWEEIIKDFQHPTLISTENF